MLETIVSYLHYIGFMTLFAALLAQHLLFSRQLSAAEVIRLARIDGLYGASALVVLMTGLLKVFAVGTPAEFYLANGFFHAKVGVFVLTGLLSAWPTVRFVRARREANSAGPSATVSLPGAIAHLQRMQLAGVLLIPLLAALMVRYPL